MENFVLYDEIEKNSEQVIYKARRKGTIKYLAVACAEKHRRPLISNHVRVSHELKHKNVLQFYEWYETSNHLWLVMELCTGGSLEQVIREDRFLSESVIRKFGTDIVRGLRYVHSRGVVFNRLLPSRFLLDGSGTVKLFDFSLAHAEDEVLEDLLTRFCEEDDYQNDCLRDLTVHSEYDSPEAITQNSNSKMSDYWGLGCLFYNMFYGRPPFTSTSQEELDRRILHQEPDLSNSDVNSPPSPLFKSLLSALLTKSVSKRINENDLIKHPFWHQRISVTEPVNSTENTTVINKTSTDTRSDESKLSTYEKVDSTNIKSKNSDDTPTLSHYNEKLINTMEGNEKPQSFDSAISNSDASTSSVPPVSENEHTLHAITNAPLNNNSTNHDNRNHHHNYNSNNNDNHNHNTLSTNNTTNGGNIQYSKSGEQQITNSNGHSTVNNTHNTDKLKMRKNQLYANDRMVQSEYNTATSTLSQAQEEISRNIFNLTRTTATVHSDEKGYTFNLDSLELSTFKSLQLRSNLALIYPWGDDSTNFPREMKSISDLWTAFTTTTNNNNSNSTNNSDSDQKKGATDGGGGGVLNSYFHSGWRPKPLSDYIRWARVMPPTKVDGLTRLYNPIALHTISAEELDQHICEVVSLFRTRSSDASENTSSRLSTIRSSPNRSAIKSYRTNLLGYLIWLMAAANSSRNKSRLSVNSAADARSHLIGIQMAPDLLIELTKQLRSGAVLPSDVRTGLCRLCSLVSFRVASFLIQLNNNELDVDPLNLISPSTGTLFSNCLTVLIDIIRESSSRCSLRLRQAAVIALGEVLTCCTCLLAHSSQKSGTLTIDAQAIQWQTAVHHLIRIITSSSITSATLGSNSAANEPASILDAFDNTSIRTGESALGGRNSLTVEETTTTTSTNITTKITEIHVRLSAAKSLDAFVTAIHGCQLYDVTVSGSLNESISACLQSVTTGDIVSRLWSHGIMDSSTNRTGINPIQQELTLSCATTLAGIIRLNPSLFTSGLIDRVGSLAFIGLIEPPASGLACQQTDLIARLLSTATSGLLPPLIIKSSNTVIPKVKRAHSLTGKISRHSITGIVGAGTPAACRRLLSEQKFINAIFRHLESPHAMLRAKAFLLCSAILANSPQESLPIACNHRLPSLLERNLKATRTLNHRYNDAFDYSLTKSSNISSVSSGQNSESPSTVYLAACITHMADILVYDIIPTICHQILLAVGLITTTTRKTTGATNPFTRQTSTSSSSRKTSRTSSANVYSRQASTNSISSGGGSTSSSGQTSNLNGNASSSQINSRALLAAFSCLPVILSGCGPIRLRLFHPQDLKLSSSEVNSKECYSTNNAGVNLAAVSSSSSSSSSSGVAPNGSSSESKFCLLSFISRLLDHWTSADSVSVAAGLFSVHHSGSFEEEILSVVLTIIEDISQQSNLVEKRKQDLICLILPGLARLAVCSNTKPEVRSICVKIITNLASVFLGESDIAGSTASLVELERAYSVTSFGSEDHNSSSQQLRKYDRVSTGASERPLSADADVLLTGVTKMKKNDKTNSYSNLHHGIPSRMTTSHYTPGRPSSEYTNKPRGSLGNAFGGGGAGGGGHTRVKNYRIDPNQNPDCIGSAIQPPSPDYLMLNKGNSLLTCPEITAPTAFLRLFCLLLKCASHDCYFVKYSSSNNTLTTPTSNPPINNNNNNTSKNQEIYDSTKDFIQQLIIDETHMFIKNFSTYGLDISLVRLLASQLLSSSSSSFVSCQPLSSSTGSTRGGSVTSNLCLTLFELIPLLFRWSNLCKPDYLIIKLRLLELVTIACLEIGQILVPETNSNDEGNQSEIVNKKLYTPGKQSTINQRIRNRYKSPSGIHATKSDSHQHSVRLLPAVSNVCAPMLAALGAMNALLGYVADLVRLALAARASNAPDAKKTAMAAEEILIAARPHPKLAGLLARLIGLWRPHRLPTIQPNVCEADLHDWKKLITTSIQEQNYEDQICFQLCEASITALTNYASLYGGEYSRSALVPSSTDSLSLGLLRLAEEDQLLQMKQHHVSKETLKNSSDSFNSKRSTHCRRRMRLLLRIIRRLVFSDPVCRARLGSPTSSTKFSTNLFTTLRFLLIITQRSADASTSKLLREIIDLLSPTLRPNHERNAISTDRNPHNRSTPVQAESSSNRIISKAAA
ncbi:unnamed protein product [Trichobilharzia szidati]|nr:unnamed protein product [Trichobilharzia szidati]